MHSFFFFFLDVDLTKAHKRNLDRWRCESCCGQQSTHPISATIECARKRICVQLCRLLRTAEAICFKCETFLQIRQHVKKQKPNFPADFYRRNNWFEWNHTAARQVLKHALKWIWDIFPAALGLAWAAVQLQSAMMSAMTVMLQMVKQWRRLRLMLSFWGWQSTCDDGL